MTLDIEWFGKQKYFFYIKIINNLLKIFIIIYIAESKDEEATGTLVLRDIAPDDLDY